jgi:trimeric autotransporter adhesin
MAQTNFTPILLYASSTPTAVPSAGNLTNSATGSEIAINIADKNLFFKDSGGVVNTIPIRQSSTSSNGWLSSTDWNTFNSKAPATSGTSLLYGNGSGGFSNVTIGTGITFAGGTLSATGSGGTVTSVTGTSPVVSSGGTTPAISLATAYGDTLNPYASKTANYILAAPNGSAGVPTFRALVAADLPSLSGTYIPYTSASSAIDLNAQTVTNIAHLGINSIAVPDILLRAYGDNNSTSRIGIRGYSSNASSSSMRVAKFRGTFASPQAPLSGDSLGKFELAGYGTTSSNGYPQASYEGVATENWGATARGAKTLFYVTPNTTITQTVALTLDQDKSATFASSVTATSFSGSGSSLTGVVTSVTGTSPVVSSGGQTPAISMPAATTSVSGYLTSTDWNTFNNKGSGTVTSVTGTAPVVSSGGATPAISMAAATSSVNGYLTSTDWTTFNNKSNTNGTVTSVAALTLGTTGTDLSSTVATGTTTPVITLNVPTASASNRGALSSTDWSTFNGKQAALVSGTNIKTVGGVSLLGSGDIGVIGATYGGTGVNNGSNTITLSGNLTHAGAFTQSFTATANTAVTLPAGATASSNNLLSSATAVGIITGTPSVLNFLRGDGTWATPAGAGTVTSVSGTGTVNGITLTGTVTTTGSLTLGGTLSGVSLTSQVSGTLPIANGGTNSTATPTAGGAVYGTGTAHAITAAGTTSQVLVSNGASAPTWNTQLVSANMPVGSIVQVVQSNYSTAVTTSNTSSSPVDTGLSATITPKSATNKILVLVSQVGCSTNSSVYCAINLFLLRASNYIYECDYNLQSYSISTFLRDTITFHWLDSPATTSATTYSTKFSVQSGGAGSVGVQGNSSQSVITLIEVVA